MAFTLTHKFSNIGLSAFKAADKPGVVYMDSTSVEHKSFVNINDLPDEMLINIMKHLQPTDLLNAQKVCKRWSDVSQEPALWLNKMYVVGMTNPAEVEIEILQRMPQLRSCTLAFDTRLVEALYTYCRNITRLDIICTLSITTAFLKNLVERCTLITDLRLPVRFLTTEHLVEQIARLKHLQMLSLHVDNSNWHSQPLLLRPIADGCHDLEYLKLWCFVLSDVGYFFRARLPLKRISLRWTTLEKRCVVPKLLSCRDTLEHLTLEEYDVKNSDSHQAFTALGRLTNLRRLDCCSVKECPPEVMALAFSSGGLSLLHTADFSNSWALDDLALAAIVSGCPLLEKLQLCGCHSLTDEAFRNINQLKHIKRLDISRCGGLGGKAIIYVARTKTIISLRMENTNFRRLQPGIKYIIEMTQLRHLHIGIATNLSAVPFELFPNCLPNLKLLDVRSSKFSTEVIDRLRDHMPQLKVRDIFVNDCDGSSDETSEEEDNNMLFH